MSQDRLGQLTKVVIRGFKSLKECEIDFRNINVLIGANGAGKTNLFIAFEMLQSILAGSLTYFANKKGTETLFYDGKEVTESILAEFHFDDDIYSFEIEWTENNTLAFVSESLMLDNKEVLGEGGHNESRVLKLLRSVSTETEIAKQMLNPAWTVYRFQDTTVSARTKSEHSTSNNIAFMADGRNIAAFLYRIKRSFQKDYDAILRAVQLVAPYFEDFVLEPNEFNDELISLKWKHKQNQIVYGASQLSDGTLRFICLATLLLQPASLQPSVIIIDEPELGLHPFAISIFAEMAHRVAVDRQVILATQSTDLLNYFTADDIIVVDYDRDGSSFERKSNEQLAYWLENDYSLGELWNNNVLGGRFAR